MKLKRYSVEEFKQAAREAATTKSLIEDAALVKDFVADEIKALDGEGDAARSFEFAISTETVDRQGDAIAVDGWALESYRKNPVVLFAHLSDELPVASAPAVWPENAKLRSKADFSQTYDVVPMARMVCQLLARKVLNAASVGFRPLSYSFNEARGPFAIDFIEQELLEWSIVPVPANAEALQGAKSAGVDLAPLVEWAEKLLDGERGPGLWLPKATLLSIADGQPDSVVARVHAIAKGEPASVSVPAKIEPPAPDPMAEVKAAIEAIDKAGRVLSAANESTLRDAAEGIQAAADRIQSVLAQVAAPDDDGKSAPVVFELAPSPDPEPVISLTPDEVKSLAETVDRRVHDSLILPLTGKLY